MRGLWITRVKAMCEQMISYSRTHQSTLQLLEAGYHK